MSDSLDTVHTRHFKKFQVIQKTLAQLPQASETSNSGLFNFSSTPKKTKKLSVEETVLLQNVSSCLYKFEEANTSEAKADWLVQYGLSLIALYEKSCQEGSLLQGQQKAFEQLTHELLSQFKYKGEFKFFQERYSISLEKIEEIYHAASQSKSKLIQQTSDNFLRHLMERNDVSQDKPIPVGLRYLVPFMQRVTVKRPYQIEDEIIRRGRGNKKEQTNSEDKFLSILRQDKNFITKTLLPWINQLAELYPSRVMQNERGEIIDLISFVEGTGYFLECGEQIQGIKECGKNANLFERAAYSLLQIFRASGAAQPSLRSMSSQENQRNQAKLEAIKEIAISLLLTLTGPQDINTCIGFISASSALFAEFPNEYDPGFQRLHDVIVDIRNSFIDAILVNRVPFSVAVTPNVQSSDSNRDATEYSLAMANLLKALAGTDLSDTAGFKVLKYLSDESYKLYGIELLPDYLLGFRAQLTCYYMQHLPSVTDVGMRPLDTIQRLFAQLLNSKFDLAKITSKTSDDVFNVVDFAVGYLCMVLKDEYLNLKLKTDMVEDLPIYYGDICQIVFDPGLIELGDLIGKMSSEELNNKMPHIFVNHVHLCLVYSANSVGIKQFNQAHIDECKRKISLQISSLSAANNVFYQYSLQETLQQICEQWSAVRPTVETDKSYDFTRFYPILGRLFYQLDTDATGNYFDIINEICQELLQIDSTSVDQCFSKDDADKPLTLRMLFEQIKTEIKLTNNISESLRAVFSSQLIHVYRGTQEQFDSSLNMLYRHYFCQISEEQIRADFYKRYLSRAHRGIEQFREEYGITEPNDAQQKLTVIEYIEADKRAGDVSYKAHISNLHHDDEITRVLGEAAKRTNGTRVLPLLSPHAQSPATPVNKRVQALLQSPLLRQSPQTGVRTPWTRENNE